MGGGIRAFELAEQVGVAAERQVRVDPSLEGNRALLLEPCDLRLCEVLVRDVGERRAAPEREPLAQARSGLGRAVVLERRRALADELLEALDVELAGLDAQRVRAPVRLKPPSLAVAQPAPQLRDMVLQNLGGRGGRRSTPQRVDQSLAGDRLVAMQQKEHQDAALPPLADPDGTVPVIADL